MNSSGCLKYPFELLAFTSKRKTVNHNFLRYLFMERVQKIISFPRHLLRNWPIRPLHRLKLFQDFLLVNWCIWVALLLFADPFLLCLLRCFLLLLLNSLLNGRLSGHLFFYFIKDSFLLSLAPRISGLRFLIECIYQFI